MLLLMRRSSGQHVIHGCSLRVKAEAETGDWVQAAFFIGQRRLSKILGASLGETYRAADRRIGLGTTARFWLTI
jgi:hypothetical protein